MRGFTYISLTTGVRWDGMTQVLNTCFAISKESGNSHLYIAKKTYVFFCVMRRKLNPPLPPERYHGKSLQTTNTTPSFTPLAHNYPVAHPFPPPTLHISFSYL